MGQMVKSNYRPEIIEALENLVQYVRDTEERGGELQQDMEALDKMVPQTYTGSQFQRVGAYLRHLRQKEERGG